MQRTALIVAAGTGSRMESPVPKQFLLLAGKPILYYSLAEFVQYDPTIKLIVVLAPNEIQRWQDLCSIYDISIPHEIVSGGATRTDSVRNGLAKVSEGLVAIHDGARPLVSQQVIAKTFSLAEKQGSGVVCVKPKDSIRELKDEGSVALNRDEYRLMQTPQTFQVKIIKTAFEKLASETGTDDATIVEKAGFPISLVEGEYSNIKITTPEDIILAEALLSLIVQNKRKH